MGRIIIPGARTASPARRVVLPSWLKGRASLYFDPTDDRLTGTIPVDLTGAGAWTILARLKSTNRVTATNRGAVAFGTNGAGQGAFLGKVIGGGLEYFGGGLIGTTLADSEHCKQVDWADCMIRYAGGVGGALTLVVDGRATSTVATAAIAGTVAELGRLLVAGTCFGGVVSDARIISRAISDAEYDEWRRGESAPVTTRRFWTCENPGYGATVHEEIGNTDDVLTGAVYDPAVPFRRRRIVEDVAAATKHPSAMTTITIVNHANLCPGASSFAAMGWLRMDSLDKVIVAKLPIAGWPAVVGWFVYGTASSTVLFGCKDGVTSINVSAEADPSRLGRWIHLAIGRDSVLALNMIRVNASRPTVVATGALGNVDNANDLIFGHHFGIDNPLVGSLNDFIWRKGAPFTWDEIEAHYYDGVIPTNPGGGVVQIGWAMREPSGLVAVSIPAGYNGTLSADSHTTATRCHARTAA